MIFPEKRAFGKAYGKQFSRNFTQKALVLLKRQNFIFVDYSFNIDWDELTWNESRYKLVQKNEAAILNFEADSLLSF